MVSKSTMEYLHGGSKDAAYTGALEEAMSFANISDHQVPHCTRAGMVKMDMRRRKQWTPRFVRWLAHMCTRQ